MEDCLLTEKALDEAYEIVCRSEECVRTPLLKNVQNLKLLDNISDQVKLHLKLENMQTTGSFKIRGVTTQMKFGSASFSKGGLVTMSAGNYGKAFAYMCKRLGLEGTVVMPKTAPHNRETLIKKLGCSVCRMETKDLMKKVEELVEERQMTFLQPFDDINLIAGYGSAGLEILEEIEPDVVLVCCGGGGLLAGISSAIRLRGHNKCRIYGVEPETANSMELSFKEGKPAPLPNASSVAAGLAPPFAGSICYAHAKAHVDGILIVSDQEIVAATKALYNGGILVEPSGAASFAAVMFNKVPELCGNIVVVVTGGNATPEELSEMFRTQTT